LTILSSTILSAIFSAMMLFLRGDKSQTPISAHHRAARK